MGIALAALSFLAIILCTNRCRLKAKKAEDHLKMSQKDEKRLKSEIDNELKSKEVNELKSQEVKELKSRAVKELKSETVKEYDSKDPAIIKLANQILDDLFDCYTNPKYDENRLKEFSFSIFHPQATTNRAEDKSLVTPPLLVKFKSGDRESTLSLMTIIKAIQWNKLDSKWANLTEEQSKKINKNAYSGINFQGWNHLQHYTVSSFKSMNLFLRMGKISQKILGPSSTYIWDDMPWTHENINRVAKERFFSCLRAAAILKEHPLLTPPKLVVRAAKSDNSPDFLNKYEKGNIVIEQSFLSTSNLKKSKFEGDIEYFITPAPKSSGRDIHDIAQFSHEKEFLFPPFTSFKVEDIQYKEKNGTIIEVKRFKDIQRKMLDTNIIKIIKLSEIQSV